MKTAIHELIELLEDDGYRFNPNIIQEALEKEKQQIIDFGTKCTLVKDIDLDGNIIFCFDPEELYTQTFNQQLKGN